MLRLLSTSLLRSLLRVVLTLEVVQVQLAAQVVPRRHFLPRDPPASTTRTAVVRQSVNCPPRSTPLTRGPNRPLYPVTFSTPTTPPNPLTNAGAAPSSDDLFASNDDDDDDDDDVENLMAGALDTPSRPAAFRKLARTQSGNSHNFRSRRARRQQQAAAAAVMGKKKNVELGGQQKESLKGIKLN